MKEYYNENLMVVYKQGRKYRLGVSKEYISEEGFKIIDSVSFYYQKPLISSKINDNKLISIVEQLQLRDYNIEAEDILKCIEKYDNE